MELRLKLEGEDVGKQVQRNMDRLGQSVREAMQEAADEAAASILERGRADIAAGGNFGEDWQEALHADVTETQRTVRVEASMQPKGPPVTFWKVFEHGATIFAHNAKGLLTWPNKSDFSIDGKVPLFISKESVRIPQKFHLTQIIREEAAKAGAAFRKIMDGKR